MVVRDSEVEQCACVALDVYRAAIEGLGCVDVALLELLCSLFEAAESLGLCGIGGRRMRGGRGGGA